MNFEYAIALTGGIATGKSTVASFLTMYGFKKIDADKIAHELLDINSDFISNTFGSDYILNGKVDRKKLGSLIFNNKDKKKILESFLHPKIKDEIIKQADELDLLKSPYLVDIPLFFEKKSYDIKRVLLVYVNKDTQFQRLLKRDGFSNQEALSRISSQMDIEEKYKIVSNSDYGFIIDNNYDLSHLQKECENFKIEILKTFSID
jgi:dephospho-CoA kinase